MHGTRSTILLAFIFAVAACGGTGIGGGTGGTGGSGGGGTGGSGGGGSGGTGGSGGGGSGGTGGSGGGGDMGPGGPGNCPSGYTTGTANGIPVCKSAAGIPLFSHVFLIMMENTSWSTLSADTKTPYIHNTLVKNAAYATDYHGVTHPSLPNYLAVISGDVGKQSDASAVMCDCNPTGTPACTNSCTRISEPLQPCGCPQTGMQLGDQLTSWKAYAEEIGSPCNPTSSGNYAARHVPFIYFMHDSDLMGCQSHVIDYGMLSADLMGTTPSFVYVAPSLVDDMHGVGLAGQTQADRTAGDTWLSMNVPTILNSAAYKNGGVLFIVWDEDDGSGGIAGTSDDPVPMFVLSPLATSGGATSMTKYDHYALLATIEDGLALARLGNAAMATPMADFFPAK